MLVPAREVAAATHTAVVVAGPGVQVYPDPGSPCERRFPVVSICGRGGGGGGSGSGSGSPTTSAETSIAAIRRRLQAFALTTDFAELPLQTGLAPHRTSFMDQLAVLSGRVFGNPLGLTLFVSALALQTDNRDTDEEDINSDDNDDASEAGGIGAPNHHHRRHHHFFGIPVDEFGLYKAAVKARLRSECANDVDPRDMLRIVQLLMASAIAVDGEALNFDSAFVDKALKGKVSSAEPGGGVGLDDAVDHATVLRKNRPTKWVCCVRLCMYV